MDFIMPLADALGFLIKALTIGVITGAVLAVLGIMPIQFIRHTYIFTKEDKDEVLKKMNIVIGNGNDEPEDEEDFN